MFTDGKECFAADVYLNLGYFPMRAEEHVSAIEIIGTSRGLVLLGIERNSGSYPIPTQDLYLWNPTTKQTKKVPGGWGFLCALGYDSLSKTHKIVKFLPIFKSFGEDLSVAVSGYEIWVLNVKPDEIWRLTHVFEDSIASVCPLGNANGFMYCSFSDYKNWCIRVGCFDLATEKFFKLKSFCCSNDGGMLRSMKRANVFVDVAFLEGNVMLKKSNGNAQMDEFFLPVLDRKRGLTSGNWKKAFTYELQERVTNYSSVIPLAYSRDGACVLLYTRNELFWFNLETKTKVRLEGLGNIFDCFAIWESVILLENDTANTILV